MRESQITRADRQYYRWIGSSAGTQGSTGQYVLALQGTSECVHGRLLLQIGVKEPTARSGTRKRSGSETAVYKKKREWFHGQ